MGEIKVKKILNIVQGLLDLPSSRIWTDYDKEADVLYINFKESHEADDSEITDEDVIIRYKKRDIIGLTIINASKRGI